MAEQLSHSPETTRPTSEVRAERPKSAEYNEHDKAEMIEHAQAAVAAESSKTEQPKTPHLPPEDDRPYLIDNAVKMHRLRKNLAHVQHKLRPGERQFSKVVHQPLVRRVSEVASTSVARPSGILGGGIFAFLGSSIYLYLARSADIRYNFTFFIGFFVGGFILGLLVEYLVSRLRRR
jgi:hypothetical protein